MYGRCIQWSQQAMGGGLFSWIDRALGGDGLPTDVTAKCFYDATLEVMSPLERATYKHNLDLLGSRIKQ